MINPAALVGILGQNMPSFMTTLGEIAAGDAPPELADDDRVEYFALDPAHLADQIVYAMNQPWGVSIGDITVRASGDSYII